MKFVNNTSTLAIVALMGTVGFAMAESTSSYEASVSVLSPDQTGFIIGGQVSVGGLGSGALTMSRSAASMTLEGSAVSGLADTDNDGSINGSNSVATVTSILDFDRSITTSGSLVGIGNVTSRGEAIAALGSAGAASANTSTAGDDGVDQGSSTAEASAQGSLNGSLSTSNTLQLLGTSGLFVGSNGLTVAEDNQAYAYGSADILGDGVTGIELDDAQFAGNAFSGQGALFNVGSTLANPIAISVSNAGNGTIAITTSTGGFFTGGGAAGGAATFADTDSFFD